MSNLTAYKNMRNILKTGDIVLFSGKGAFSTIIKLFSGSKWSHVGMVVKVDDMDMVLLWESTGLSKVKDIVDGITKNGVQTVSLSQRLDAYDGEIAFKQLNKPIDNVMKKTLVDMRSELKNKPYEKSKAQLAKSLLDLGFLSENEEDLSSVFCSELVGEALQRMAIMNNLLPANEFVPKDFGDNGRFEKYLQGYSYGPEIQIK